MKNIINENGNRQGYWVEEKFGLINKGHYVDGKKEGVWAYYDGNDKVMHTKTFSNGLLHGKLISYYEDGSQMRVEEYQKGLYHGKQLLYHKNALISSIRMYNKGECVGKYSEMLDNGVMFYQVDYDNNYEYYWYEGTTILESKGQISPNSGLKDGEWSFYDENGVLYKKCNYHLDHEDGLCETYVDGNVTYSEFINGEEYPVIKHYWEDYKEEDWKLLIKVLGLPQSTVVFYTREKIIYL